MIANIISADPISTDARLVESVLNGNRDAFAELVTRDPDVAVEGARDLAR